MKGSVNIHSTLTKETDPGDVNDEGVRLTLAMSTMEIDLPWRCQWQGKSTYPGDVSDEGTRLTLAMSLMKDSLNIQSTLTFSFLSTSASEPLEQ